MKIYTKTGDSGETSLYGGQRVPKGNPRLEAYGTVDETNAALGVALTQVAADYYDSQLKSVQHDLFVICSELAAPAGQVISGLELINEQQVSVLEKSIDELQSELPVLQNFVFPRGTLLAAQLQLARTICRRAERAVVRLSETEEVRPLLIKYLNRLSDFLFVLARHANLRAGKAEITWRGRAEINK